jgi:hypothetical protein
VSILTGLTLEAVALATSLSSVDLSVTLSADTGSAGTATSAATATTAATLTVTTATATLAITALTALAIATVSTATTAAALAVTTATATSATAATTATGGLGTIIDHLETLLVATIAARARRILDHDLLASFLGSSLLLLHGGSSNGLFLDIIGVLERRESVHGFRHSTQHIAGQIGSHVFLFNCYHAKAKRRDAHFFQTSSWSNF